MWSWEATSKASVRHPYGAFVNVLTRCIRIRGSPFFEGEDADNELPQNRS